MSKQNYYISHRVFLQPSFIMECFTTLSILLRKENVILLGFAPLNKRETNLIIDPLNMSEMHTRSMIEKCIDSLQ